MLSFFGFLQVFGFSWIDLLRILIGMINEVFVNVN